MMLHFRSSRVFSQPRSPQVSLSSFARTAPITEPRLPRDPLGAHRSFREGIARIRENARDFSILSQPAQIQRFSANLGSSMGSSQNLMINGLSGSQGPWAPRRAFLGMFKHKRRVMAVKLENARNAYFRRTLDLDLATARLKRASADGAQTAQEFRARLAAGRDQELIRLFAKAQRMFLLFMVSVVTLGYLYFSKSDSNETDEASDPAQPDRIAAPSDALNREEFEALLKLQKGFENSQIQNSLDENKDGKQAEFFVPAAAESGEPRRRKPRARLDIGDRS